MRKAFGILLGIVGLGALLLQAVTSFERSRALRLQAEAALTASQTAHTAVAVNAALVYAVLCLAALLVASTLFFGWRLRAMSFSSPRSAGASKGKWLPGPNAYWGRKPAFPEEGLEHALGRLIQIQTLRALQALANDRETHLRVSTPPTLPPSPPAPEPPLPGASPDEDEGLGDLWEELWG